MDWLADGLPTGYRLMAAQTTDGKTKILEIYIKIIKILFHYSTTTRTTFPLCYTKPNSLYCTQRQLPLNQYGEKIINHNIVMPGIVFIFNKLRTKQIHCKSLSIHSHFVTKDVFLFFCIFELYVLKILLIRDENQTTE